MAIEVNPGGFERGGDGTPSVDAWILCMLLSRPHDRHGFAQIGETERCDDPPVWKALVKGDPTGELLHLAPWTGGSARQGPECGS